MRAELEKKRLYLSRNLSEKARADIQKQADYIQGVLDGEIE
jgi:hypothetical protein